MISHYDTPDRVSQTGDILRCSGLTPSVNGAASTWSFGRALVFPWQG